MIWIDNLLIFLLVSQTLKIILKFLLLPTFINLQKITFSLVDICLVIQLIIIRIILFYFIKHCLYKMYQIVVLIKCYLYSRLISSMYLGYKKDIGRILLVFIYY